MALSGTFSNAYRGYTYQISWSATQNTSGNYSTVTCVHKLICGSTWSLDIGNRNNTCVVNGSSVSFTSNEIHTGGSATFTLGTTTHTVNHNSDGTGSFSVTGTFNMQATISGVWVGSIVTSGSATLNTIARASSITSASNVVLGNNCNVTFTPTSSSFYYQMYFTIGAWTVSTGWFHPGTTSSYTYNYLNLSGTLADENKDTIYSQLSDSTSGTMTVELRTYSSRDTSTYIGTSSKTFTVTIPESIKPTISSNNISLSPTTYSYLIQNKNAVQINVSGCSAGTGSSIASYTYSGPGISTGDIASTSATSGTISTSGTLTYTVTVKDTRGRTASATKSITCHPYTVPYFTSFSAYRVASSSSTAVNDSGAYIRCAYNLSYSSVSGSNKVTVKLKYKTSTGSWTTLDSDIENSTATSGSKIISKTGGFGIDTTYVVCAEISDSYGGSNTSTSVTIFSAERILNVRPNGSGIAFGKMAESNNLFECKWPAKFDNNCSIVGGLAIGESTQSSPPTTGIKIHDVRNATITPKSFGDYNANFYFDDISGWWHSVLHMHGWSSDYAAWELAGNAHNSSRDDSLKYRQGVGDTWGDWQTVFTNKNYTNYVVAKPTTLYSSSAGTYGTITLSYSAANFTYLEIFYMDNNSNGHNSIKIYSPNGKQIDISTVEPSDATASRTYIRRSLYTISGTSLTPSTTVCGYVCIDGSTDTGLDVTHVGGQNFLKIHRVIGYN